VTANGALRTTSADGRGEPDNQPHSEGDKRHQQMEDIAFDLLDME
jgi:hypothetical protein